MSSAQHQPANPSKLHNFTTKLITPQVLGFSSVVLLLLFVFYVIVTFGPVALVEAKFQTRRGLEAAFGTSSLAQIFIPNFEGMFDLRGLSEYREYGIVIPKLYLDEPVVFNVDPNDKQAYTEALKLGIAHASATSFPDTGGLGYYFAHSSQPDLRNQYNAIFYLLGKLEPKDEVFIWHEGERYEYSVTEKLITRPGDVSFLYDNSYPNESIVLQTCWPPGTTTQRMLVFAERVE